ncbi:MAG TPA: glycosyltransferase family 4 protein [Candidatus Polarisedimenticolaceae bacterium]|nr:glycosyltransferase family 4 protein [Candidatus Polarisedimenticolaceae bacterium]
MPWYKPLIGGVVLAVERVAQSLVRSGHRVWVLRPGESPRIEQVGSDEGVPLFAFDMRSGFVEKGRARALVSYLVHFVPTMVELKRFIDRNEIDVTIINYPSSYETYFTALELLFDLPYCVCVHGSDVNRLGDEPPLKRWAVRTIVQRANGFIACSQALMESAERTFARLPAFRRVVHIGVDPSFSDGTKSTNASVHGKYILTLAWATPDKGPDVAIDAFAEIKDRYPDVSLLMVGSGPMEDELRNSIERLGLQGRVVRLGTLEPSSLPDLYAGALFGVIPSRNEGFGRVALEFQLFGKAIVASRVGGLPEAVEDGHSGRLVPPGDSGALARAMSELLDRPEECNRMGTNGRASVMNRFTLDRTGEGYVSVLNHILTRR